jgi:hypothetical protein
VDFAFSLFWGITPEKKLDYLELIIVTSEASPVKVNSIGWPVYFGEFDE